MKIKIFTSGSIVFFAIVACVVPGLKPAVPPLDMSNIPTVIALTANAAMTQTAAVAPPIPVETSLPQSEATAIMDLSGVTTLEQLPDGSTKFTDSEAGYVVVFPEGWLTLRPNSEEFTSAFEKEATRNETLHEQMQSDLTDYEAGLDRLYSYPLLPEIDKNSMFGAARIQWDSSDTTPVDESFMGDFIRGMETSGGIPGFRTDTARVYENDNYVKLIEVGGQFTINDGQGGFIPFYVTSIFFQPTRGGVVMIIFTYWKDLKLPISSDVMTVIDSVELVSQ